MTYDEIKQLALAEQAEPAKAHKHPQDKEHQLQVACIHWFDLQYKDTYPLFAVPNGGWRNAITAKKLKAEGVRAGVADLFLSIPTASYHGLYIEMKIPVTGKQSDNQIMFQHRVESYGYKYVICKTIEEFMEIVKEYIHDHKLLKSATAKPDKDSLLRKKEERLKEMIAPYVSEFGSDICNDFWRYWSEPNKSHTKLRWEMQPTWDTRRRLLTWQKNNLNRK